MMIRIIKSFDTYLLLEEQPLLFQSVMFFLANNQMLFYFNFPHTKTIK